MKLISKVYKTIKGYGMLHSQDRVIVAVSGGSDSVALLNCLFKLRNALELNEIIVAHLNHMFRGKDAEEDARFVEKTAKNLGLRVFIESRNIPELMERDKLSPQDAARRERYDFLHGLAKKLNAKIALGHHADDQAETILMHFLKGSGTEGLKAMEPVNGNVIRPFLYVKKNEILKYCKEEGLSLRDDPSNRKEIYLRNKIRLKLMPLLVEEYNPNLVDVLLKTSEVMRAENNLLESIKSEAVQAVVKYKEQDKMSLSLSGFLAQDLAIKRRVVRQCYNDLIGNTRGLLYRHVEDVIELSENSNTGSYVNLPAGVVVRKSYEDLLFYKDKGEGGEETSSFSHYLSIPGSFYINELDLMIRTELMDAKSISNEEIRGFLSGSGEKAVVDFNKIKGRLFVRNRCRGDRFVPYGMKGKRKLKDFLIDNKVPRESRDLIPLITCGTEVDNSIIWVAGLRISEEYKVDEDTLVICIISME